MQSEIKRWGNSGAVRLTSRILAQASLAISSPIQIHVEHGRIVIEAASEDFRRVKLPFAESELIAGLDAHTAHADELATPSVSEMGA